jgi:hypothetical protein
MVGLNGEIVLKIVKEWPNFFLRDDLEIRQGWADPEQAYSLFRSEPYGREIVFAGCSEEEAIGRAEYFVLFNNLISRKVRKRSNKPFKSGNKVNTVSDMLFSRELNKWVFTFVEDKSSVECWRCLLVEETNHGDGR